jgi:hypothetical protein
MAIAKGGSWYMVIAKGGRYMGFRLYPRVGRCMAIAKGGSWYIVIAKGGRFMGCRQGIYDKIYGLSKKMKKSKTNVTIA